jgi:hypothetical protein
MDHHETVVFDRGRRSFLRRSSSLLLAGGAGVSTPMAAQQQPRTRVFHAPACLLHVTGADHPERPARLEAVMAAMRSLEGQGRVAIAQAPSAREDDVLLVHTRLPETVRREIAEGATTLSTGDTALSPDRGSGSGWRPTVVAAVDAVMSAVPRTLSARCARPVIMPAARGMGFCLFNNVAIGVRVFRRATGGAGADRRLGRASRQRDENCSGPTDRSCSSTPIRSLVSGSRRRDRRGRVCGLIVNRPFPRGGRRRSSRRSATYWCLRRTGSSRNW